MMTLWSLGLYKIFQRFKVEEIVGQHMCEQL